LITLPASASVGQHWLPVLADATDSAGQGSSEKWNDPGYLALLVSREPGSTRVLYNESLFLEQAAPDSMVTFGQLVPNTQQTSVMVEGTTLHCTSEPCHVRTGSLGLVETHLEHDVVESRNILVYPPANTHAIGLVMASSGPVTVTSSDPSGNQQQAPLTFEYRDTIPRVPRGSSALSLLLRSANSRSRPRISQVATTTLAHHQRPSRPLVW
jgi:hypothetical protein